MGKHRENEEEIVHVDFDFFDIQDDDFLSVKSLLRQTFGADNLEFNLSVFAQSCVEAIGSAVKADDKEYNDVLAVLCIGDVAPDVKMELLNYYIKRLAHSPTAQRVLLQLRNTPANVGILYSERFLNMPLEIVSPLYTLISQEIAGKKLPEYLLVPTRLYSEQPEDMLETCNKDTLYPYHMEDDTLASVSQLSEPFEYINKAVQGDLQPIKQFGRLIVLKTADLPQLASKLAGSWI